MTEWTMQSIKSSNITTREYQSKRKSKEKLELSCLVQLNPFFFIKIQVFFIKLTTVGKFHPLSNGISYQYTTKLSLRHEANANVYRSAGVGYTNLPRSCSVR
jgi:hypothetical protein